MIKQIFAALTRGGFRLWPWLLCGLCVCLLAIYWFREPLLTFFFGAYGLLTDMDKVAAYVGSFGIAAPPVFIVIQILQVIFAPIPGEATGFIGGYLFGAFIGCLYSTIALTIGSWLNFLIGRQLGKRWVRRIISQKRMEKYDHLIRRQGILVVFVFFLFPGFPKDYLCLLLGVSTIPMRVFLLIAMVGRIPGTLMLSLQGALVFDKNYLLFTAIVLINLLVVYLGYRYREAIYVWVEKFNGTSSATIDEERH